MVELPGRNGEDLEKTVDKRSPAQKGKESVDPYGETQFMSGNEPTKTMLPDDYRKIGFDEKLSKVDLESDDYLLLELTPIPDSGDISGFAVDSAQKIQFILDQISERVRNLGQNENPEEALEIMNNQLQKMQQEISGANIKQGVEYPAQLVNTLKEFGTYKNWVRDLKENPEQLQNYTRMLERSRKEGERIREEVRQAKEAQALKNQKEKEARDLETDQLVVKNLEDIEKEEDARAISISRIDKEINELSSLVDEVEGPRKEIIRSRLDMKKFDRQELENRLEILAATKLNLNFGREIPGLSVKENGERRQDLIRFEILRLSEETGIVTQRVDLALERPFSIEKTPKELRNQIEDLEEAMDVIISETFKLLSR
ncbi:hypothetical protein KKC60_02050, partial [Patescibacteria group bacterium]|nr:hypothetical protein [Patescibacteria group bacterium]